MNDLDSELTKQGRYWADVCREGKWSEAAAIIDRLVDRITLRPSDGWNRDMSKAPRTEIAGKVLLGAFPPTTISNAEVLPISWRVEGGEAAHNPADWERFGYWASEPSASLLGVKPFAWILVAAPPSPEAGHE